MARLVLVLLVLGAVGVLVWGILRSWDRRDRDGEGSMGSGTMRWIGFAVLLVLIVVVASNAIGAARP